MLHIAILAGGRSQRLGRDKAELRLDNKILLERTARLAHSIQLPARAVWIIGRPQPASWPHDLESTRFTPDHFPGSGPLGGLATALQAAQRSGATKVLLLPCDLPHLNRPALEWLLEQAQASRAAHGCITCHDE